MIANLLPKNSSVFFTPQIWVKWNFMIFDRTISLSFFKCRIVLCSLHHRFFAHFSLQKFHAQFHSIQHTVLLLTHTHTMTKNNDHGIKRNCLINLIKFSFRNDLNTFFQQRALVYQLSHVIVYYFL